MIYNFEVEKYLDKLKLMNIYFFSKINEYLKIFFK